VSLALTIVPRSLLDIDSIPTRHSALLLPESRMQISFLKDLAVRHSLPHIPRLRG